MQCYILGVDTGTQLAVNIDAAYFQPLHGNRLRCQYVAHLSCADTKSNGTKCAMCRCVRVTTCNRSAWLRNSLLRSYHVHDALHTRCEVKVGNVKFFSILAQFSNHGISQRIRKGTLLIIRGHDVIHCRKGALGIFDLQVEVT